MFDYSAVFVNQTGAFPNVVGRNVATPGDGTGTEWIKAFIDDHWGARQALMNYAGLTPTGVQESASASQFLEALQKAFIPAGTVVGWHGPADPSTLGIRMLPMEGQVVLIANYPDLVANTYVGDVNNPTPGYRFYYKCSDVGGSVRDTAGPYFKIGDSRGFILRGYDPTGIIDNDGPGKKFPDLQAAQIFEHEHHVHTSGVYVNPIASDTPGGTSTTMFVGGAEGGGAVQAREITNVLYNATENVMHNMQVKWCIKY